MLRPDPSAIARAEHVLQHDMTEHARRLQTFKAATQSKVWREQPNGEWWLVDLLDGETGQPVAA